nr:hypothetical protein CCACVL1_30839 [Ipomoea batatas]GMC97490.1 hypothetical protein CCACVL1_30839 [Ipomoea batatas]GMC97491.1 hypothetical protein CCACVL1_30839 [Ipomoea batatas]GME04224.1 hypothetical protein CCACVL1_30839 [Ipomoea batatas]GME04225.1 hypothetical protein CCACVL1_30839 [Ipomoea batatas]
MRQQRHSMEFRPIRSSQIIHSQIQVPQVWKIGNFKRNHILEKVSETTKVPELCQLPNLYWYCPSEVVIAQVQKSELKEAADSRWDHSAQTIVIEIDAKLAELQMMPSQLHTFVRLLTDQECSKEVDGDMPLIFHFKRASASSLFACRNGYPSVCYPMFSVVLHLGVSPPVSCSILATGNTHAEIQILGRKHPWPSVFSYHSLPPSMIVLPGAPTLTRMITDLGLEAAVNDGVAGLHVLRQGGDGLGWKLSLEGSEARDGG